MTPSGKRRFDPARSFHPATISLSGAATALGAKVLAALHASAFTGKLGLDDPDLSKPDLALIADDRADIPAALTRHAQAGAGAAIVFGDIPDLNLHARRAGIRVLGAHSFGVMLPQLGLNASLLGPAPPPGRLALVGQSASLARTVIDWALPNNIGFSHVIGIGGNADIGFGLVLDHLSRDPGTAAILVEIDRLRDPKLFHSAARAAARLRPVIALVPGIRLLGAERDGHAAFEAAFGRAGVLLTGSIAEFLAAAETLTRVKPARGEGLAIVANSVSAGRLAGDAVIESGLTLARLAPETAQVLALSLGVSPAPGPIYAGTAPTRLADIAALLSSAPEVGGILVVHTPGGSQDDAAIAALLACAQTVKIPLLIAALGEARGLAHRHRLAQAGLACFDSPEAAIAGFRHLLRNRRNRAAARELPSSQVLRIAPDKAAVAAAIAAARAAGQDRLVQDEALALIAAYRVPAIASRHVDTPEQAAAAAEALGYPVVLKLSHARMPTHLLAGSVALDLPDAAAVRDAARAIHARLAQLGIPAAEAGFVVQHQVTRGIQLRIRVAEHPMLGPVIGFGAGGGDPEDLSGLAADLPPLNLALAHALIQRAAVAPALAAHRGQPAADHEAIAATLVRVSQLIIDTPDILLLDLDPIFASEFGVQATSARILLRPPGSPPPALIISPYPAELTSRVETKGRRFLLRPIRPEDADGYAAMFARFAQEDMRFRFFSAMRRLPTEQIVRMTDIDYAREMAIIAVDETSGQPAGGARLVRSDTDGAQAEFAVGVEPAAKGHGLGTALMRAVINWGRSQGVKEITGQILADNAPMLAFIQRLGFELARVPGEPDVVEARLGLENA
jgi:acetyltransferase